MRCFSTISTAWRKTAVCVAWLKPALSHCGRDYSKEKGPTGIIVKIIPSLLPVDIASSGLSGYCNCTLELFHQLYLRMSLLRQLVSNKGTLHIKNVIFFLPRVDFFIFSSFSRQQKMDHFHLLIIQLTFCILTDKYFISISLTSMGFKWPNAYMLMI